MLVQNKALWDAKKIMSQIVTDVVNLEDINYTVPEVQTLLDGITVGGHRLQDELITLNQIRAWRFLFESIENKTFAVNKEYVLKLHSIVANQEALSWGVFRNGMVSISGTDYLPPKSDELDQLWESLVLDTSQLINPEINNGARIDSKEVKIYTAAINLFARMSRIQFFFDGNKRTGRMIMAAILLINGFPMINVPASRKTEFNQVMINYYNSQNLHELYQFLISCLHNWVVEEYHLHNIFITPVFEHSR